MRICIVGESDTKERAKLLGNCFKDIDAQIAIATIERFPLGIDLLVFLKDTASHMTDEEMGRKGDGEKS